MSQLSTGELDLTQRRSSPRIRIERTGITESLGAPGIAAIGNDSADANLLAQFDQALGIAGQFANQAETTMVRERLKDERAQAAQDQIEQGQASIDVSVDLAQDADRLQDTGLDFFAELGQSGQSLEDYVDVLFEQRTEGMSDAYKQRYEQSFKPRYISGLLARRRQLQEEAKIEVIGALGNSLAGARSAEEMRAIMESMKTMDPDINVLEQKAPLISIGLEAAARGDDQQAKAVLDVLGNDYQTEQSRIIRTQQATDERFQAERESNVFDMIQSRIEMDDPAEMIESMIKSQEDTFTTDLPIQRLRGKLASREAGKVQDQQQQNLNTTRVQVRLGVYPENDPNKAAAEIINAMTLPPSDPGFIPATSGSALLDDIERSLKTDAYRVAVESKLLGDDTLPLTASYDSALDQALADRGLVETIPNNNGQALVRSIIDPRGLAYASDVAGRVTTSVRQVIAAGLAGDREQASQAAQAYTALYRQNPVLAEQVMQNMDSKAKLRARFIQARLQFTNEPWNEQDFMQLEPVEMEPASLRQAVWAPGKSRPVFDSDVRDKARDFIEEMVNDTDFRDTFLFGFGRYIGPISTVHAEAYAEILEEEYIFAQSLVANDEQAMNMAKANAGPRFIAQNPPIVWDKEILFTLGEQETTADFQALVVNDLEEAGWTEDAIDNLVENYRPAWDPVSKAWAFRDEAGAVYRQIDGTNALGGELLLVDPYAPGTVKTIEDQKAKWEEDARKKRAQKRSGPSTFEGLDPDTIMSIP